MRNSLYTMATTVLTAGLGYIFWIVSAHVFTSSQVGIGSAVISACSTVALLTYLGSWAMLIERLHVHERSREWTALLVRMCVATATVTAVVAAVTIPFLAHSKNYGSFFNAIPAVIIAIVGSVAWTLVNLFSAAFISARRADRYLSIQVLVSVVKVLVVVPIAAAGLGAVGIVWAWVGSSIFGVVVGALWLLPRLRLGGRPRGLTSHRKIPLGNRKTGTEVRLRAGHSTSIDHREASGADPRMERIDSYPRSSYASECRQPVHLGEDREAEYPVEYRKRTYRSARPRQPFRPDISYMRRLVGHHITSVGGAATPLILPIVVVLRLGVTLNAYFYITWLIGGVFFMVSPSISNAVFAEIIRSKSNPRIVVMKAFRVTSLVLIPAMLIMIAGGKLILGIFGAPYASAGYGLLVILAISAVPDAVSNIAVAVFRVTNRIKYAATLNIGILLTTIVGSWFLMPSFGIVGVGLAWIGAQLLGAIASIPAYVNLDRRATR